MKEYFQNLEHSHSDAIFALYEKILSHNPNLSPSIKWNAPNFSKNGIDCVTFRLFPKEMFQIVLHRGAKVKNTEGFTFDDKHKICKFLAADRGTIDVLKQAQKETEILDTITDWVKVI